MSVPVLAHDRVMLPAALKTPLGKIKHAQLLSSLVVPLDDVDGEALSDGSGPNVHFQSLLRFRRPAMGVSGQESLSDSDESRLSPARGPGGRGELSNDENAGPERAEGDRPEGGEAVLEAGFVLMDNVVDPDSSEAEDVDASDDMVETEDSMSMSECANVYFTVLISSSSGVRNDTFFSAGNKGLTGAILRDVSGAGPLVRMERRLCGCL